jgi:sugar lactone lactonase YvrE
MEQRCKKGIVVAEFQNVYPTSGSGGLFVDTSGTLYTVDTYNSSITRWPQGALQGTTILSVDIQWAYSSDLAYDSRGNLYVVNRRNYSIQRFSIQ